LDQHDIPERDAADQNEWKEKFADQPLVINPAVRIPQATLELWMRNDMRFRNTWNRLRHDLRDQSQSGYDLALACFGVRIGLNAQQIIDLIAHHRALHGQKPRLRLEYFQRTISRAMRQTEGSRGSTAYEPNRAAAPEATASPLRPATSETPDGQNDPKPVPTREQLLAEISADLLVPVRAIYQMIGTDQDAQYRMELDGDVQLYFHSYAEFTDQKRVRNAIGPRVKALIPPFSKNKWSEIVNRMFRVCVDVEMPDDIETKGEVRTLLYVYFGSSAFILSIEDQPSSEQFRPMIHDGRVTIHLQDFQQYIGRSFAKRIAPKKLGGVLRALGAEPVRLRGQNYDQNRWALPIELFNPSCYGPYEVQNL
jgi:hypothetical protein